MSVVMRLVWQCDFEACGHVWYKPKKPARCAKCKKANWDKSKHASPVPPSAEVTVNTELPVVSVNVASGCDEYAGDTITVTPVKKTKKRLPKTERLSAIIEASKEHPKIGEKCPHGWANWLQCSKCNERKS